MGLNTAKLNLSFTGTIENTTNALAPISIPFSFSKSFTFAQGTGANAADIIYASRPSLSTGNLDLDLAGTLTDPAGNTVVFAEVCGIIVVNRSTTAAEIVTLGGATADFLTWLKATGDGVKIAANSMFCLCDPNADAYVVTATTADILRLTSASGTPAVDLIIWGHSA